MRYVAVASLFNLNVQDVVKYVNQLHRHIKKQNKRINKLLLKIRKMVNMIKLMKKWWSEYRRCFRNSSRNSMNTSARRPAILGLYVKTQMTSLQRPTTRQIHQRKSHLHQRNLFKTLWMKSRLKPCRTPFSKLASFSNQSAACSMTQSLGSTSRLNTTSTTTETTPTGTAWILEQTSLFFIPEQKRARLRKR